MHRPTAHAASPRDKSANPSHQLNIRFQNSGVALCFCSTYCSDSYVPPSVQHLGTNLLVLPILHHLLKTSFTNKIILNVLSGISMCLEWGRLARKATENSPSLAQVNILKVWIIPLAFKLEHHLSKGFLTLLNLFFDHPPTPTKALSP